MIISTSRPSVTDLQPDSEFLTADTISHAVLGVYEGARIGRGRKHDITSSEGFLRGIWVTIVMTDGGPLELAEVRVYGSESTAIDINTRNPPNLALLSLSFVHTHPPPLMIPSILHSTYFLCNIQRFFWFI